MMRQGYRRPPVIERNRLVTLLLISIFSLGALGAAGYAVTAFYLPAGRALPGRFLSLSACAGFALTYAVSLSVVFWSPFWMDNGVEERIFLPDHFMWALWLATVLQFAIVPITVGVFYLVRGFRGPAAKRGEASSPRRDAP